MKGIKGFKKRIFQLLIASVPKGGGEEKKNIPNRNCLFVSSEYIPKEPLPPVPEGGLANLTRGDYPQSSMTASSRDKIEGKRLFSYLFPLSEEVLKIFFFDYPLTPAKSFSAHNCPKKLSESGRGVMGRAVNPCPAYMRGLETVSVFLPLALLLARTALPELVDILRRNPCFLALFLLFG